ncbi:MAG: hypothetical protein Q4F00_09930 [bacterium]|nr:hypothetical protein [bacterium]
MKSLSVLERLVDEELHCAEHFECEEPKYYSCNLIVSCLNPSVLSRIFYNWLKKYGLESNIVCERIKMFTNSINPENLDHKTIIETDGHYIGLYSFRYETDRCVTLKLSMAIVRKQLQQGMSGRASAVPAV